MNNQKRFNQIVKDIKKVRIQGATNVAKKALYAYAIVPTKKSKKKLLSLRPTEPLLSKVLLLIEMLSYKEILNHFDSTKEKINKNIFRLIKNKDVIFTHCHSLSIVNSLIYSKKHGKNFEVYNTETRPLFQGRKTLKELNKSKIRVTQFVDSAAMIALTKKQGTKKVNKVFFGADALLQEGVVNKVGSGMFAKIAYDNKIPVYILADSWKFSKKNIELEQRPIKEVWKKVTFKKNSYIKLENPAFEFIPKKYVTKIVSDLGVLSYNDFLKKVK